MPARPSRAGCACALVALAHADGERQVAGAQARMAVFLHVARRAAEPAGEEIEQLVAGAAEVLGMETADVAGLGKGIHEFVETVHQGAHGRVAAHTLVGAGR